MPDFLILRRTGPQPTDLEACSIIQGKGGDEGEEAIREGACQGSGRYLAISMGNTTERDVGMEPVLSEPADEVAVPQAIDVPAEQIPHDDDEVRKEERPGDPPE